MTICLVSDRRSPLGRGITLVTGGDYSHAEIRCDADACFGARADGVKMRHDWREQYEHPWVSLEEWELTIGLDAQHVALRETIKACGGRPYAFGQLFATGWSYLAARCGLHRAIAIKRLNVCSEVCWRFLDACGGQVRAHLRSQEPDPNDFPPDYRELGRVVGETIVAGQSRGLHAMMETLAGIELARLVRRRVVG